MTATAGWSFEDEVIDRLARIEEKIDSMVVPSVKNHENRIRCLETFKNKSIGAGKITAIISSGSIITIILKKFLGV